MGSAFADELTAAVELALRAGHAVLPIYASEFSVSYKGPNDPVTEADQLANQIIVEGLRRRFPTDGVVAEESASEAPQAQGKSRVWYVDPIDGTKEFVARNGEFSVMIGLAIDGEARLGVVFQPATDLLMAGVLGVGGGEAWFLQGGERKSMHVSPACELSKLRLVLSRSHHSKKLTQAREALKVPLAMTSGSVGLKAGLVARAEADLYFDTSGRTQLWDSCAPEAILRAAGGRFTDIHGKPIVYDPAHLLNSTGILGSNGPCHEQAAATLSRLGLL
jgi:3'(2'), 5'-bisphosphate nucleotidase